MNEMQEQERSLYKRYRPRKLTDLLGQDGAVSSLQMFIGQKRVPQTILLSGPSGCGKTTIGRILKNSWDVETRTMLRSIALTSAELTRCVTFAGQ